MSSEPVGHQAARRAVRSALHRGRLPHALLVSGEAGIGKGRFAEWIVRAAWCAATEIESRPCEECISCRKLSSGNHPDLIIVRRDPDDEYGSRHEVTVNQIRHGLIPVLGLRPVEAPGHAAILLRADELNEEAQNALLKTLEEPPGGSMLLLTTSREDVLLETIRSRCQSLRLFPLGPSEMAAFAAEHDPADVRLARGRPGRLAELAALETGRLIEAFDGVVTGSLGPAGFAAVIEAVIEAVEDTDRLEVQRLVLDVLRTRLRDLVLAASGGEPEAALTSAPAPQALPAAAVLVGCDEALLEAGEDLRRHVPASVTWMGLGLQLVGQG